MAASSDTSAQNSDTGAASVTSFTCPLRGAAPKVWIMFVGEDRDVHPRYFADMDAAMRAAERYLRRCVSSQDSTVQGPYQVPAQLPYCLYVTFGLTCVANPRWRHALLRRLQFAARFAAQCSLPGGIGLDEVTLQGIVAKYRAAYERIRHENRDDHPLYDIVQLHLLYAVDILPPLQRILVRRLKPDDAPHVPLWANANLCSYLESDPAQGTGPLVVHYMDGCQQNFPIRGAATAASFCLKAGIPVPDCCRGYVTADGKLKERYRGWEWHEPT